MENIKQPIRKLAARSKLRPKTFVLVATIVILGIAGGVFALVRPGQDKRPDSSTDVVELKEKLSEEEQNVRDDLEYHSGTGEEVNDGPSLEIKIDGTSNANFASYMVNTDNGQSSKSVTLEIIAKGLNLADCSVTQKTTFDNDDIPSRTTKFEAQANKVLVAEDGDHVFDVDCQKAGVSSTMSLRVADNQPERCKGFVFSESSVTASSIQELSAGMVGTWKGCVSTPWVPQYQATFVFKADGTYDSYSSEVLDGRNMIALYYGTDDNNPQKKYQLTSFTNGLGTGKLTIYFGDSNTTVTNDLQNVKLMGDKLSFNFNHFGKYGPLSFQLQRQ